MLGLNPYLGAPSTDEGDFIKESSFDDLGQRLNHILNINVTDQQPQAETALQLLDTMVHILRLEQVKPVQTRYCEGREGMSSAHQS